MERKGPMDVAPESEGSLDLTSPSSGSKCRVERKGPMDVVPESKGPIDLTSPLRGNDNNRCVNLLTPIPSKSFKSPTVVNASSGEK